MTFENLSLSLQSNPETFKLASTFSALCQDSGYKQLLQMWKEEYNKWLQDFREWKESNRCVN